MPDSLMRALLTGRPVNQITQLQPPKGIVPRVEFNAHSVLGWSPAAVSIHATRNILSAPVYGSTKPNEFIQIQGIAPQAPVVVRVPTVAGSNAPLGGIHTP